MSFSHDNYAYVDQVFPQGKSVAAVVVTYNRARLLQQCIDHLFAQQVPANYTYRILVVDNASTDDTLYMLTPLIERGEIEYFNTGANLGGAGGFAFGIKAAVEAGFDYIWLLDDDCLPNQDALAELFAAGEKASQPWGFLSSVARWKDGSLCAMNIQRHPLFRNIKSFEAELQPATLASFVSLLVPAQVVYEVGLPYAEFFIWTDDWEFTRRISRRYACFVAGKSVVTHASATNRPGNIYTDGPERIDRYAYIYRNDVVLYKQEGLRGHVFLWLRALYHTLRVGLSDVEDKRARVRLIWKGTREGFSFSPRLIYPQTSRSVSR